MIRSRIGHHSRPFTLLLGLAIGTLVLFIFAYPDHVFQASLGGLKLWWEIVFPALMPFLMLTELLIGFGALRALGVLLEPLMGLLFRLPGAGGWALATGLVAGFPMGASITAKIHRQAGFTREESERLLALGHLANPMLMIGIIGAGFLQSPETGFFIAAVHYLAAILAGVILRFVVPREKTKPETAPSAGRTAAWPPVSRKRAGLIRKAMQEMQAARQEDGRTFGKLLGDSVTASIQTLLLIGGLIMLFSVLRTMLDMPLSGHTWANAVSVHLPAVLEPHLGAYAYSQQTTWPPAWQAALIGALLGWGGLSVHAQTLGLMKGTSVRYRTFLYARLLHAGLAFVLSLACWKPVAARLSSIVPHLEVFHPASRSAIDPAGWNWLNAPGLWGLQGMGLLFLLGSMILASWMLHRLQPIVERWFHPGSNRRR